MNEGAEIVGTVETIDWMSQLDERQQAEVRFAKEYAATYHHGTDGHHRLMLIAKMAWMMDNFMVGEKIGGFLGE